MEPKQNRHATEEAGRRRQAERDAWRRRIAAGERPWEDDTGYLAVVNAVRDVEFPKTLDDLGVEVGSRRVQTTGKGEHELSDVLGKLKGERDFASLKDFETALLRHWEGIRWMDVPDEQRPGHRHP